MATGSTRGTVRNLHDVEPLKTKTMEEKKRKNDKFVSPVSYIDEEEAKHLLSVNPSKTYIVLDAEIVGLLASLTEKQLMQVFKVLHKTKLTEIGDFEKKGNEPIVNCLLTMLEARKQWGRYIIDYVVDTIGY